MPKEPFLYTPTGQCCQLDEPYQAPPGYFDQPFIYVYDADAPLNGTALPDGQDRRGANIKTFTGADFLLRRVAGIDRVCTDFQLRDQLARLVFNEEVSSAFRDFVIQPELLWGGGNNISFDLLPVQKAVNGSGAFLSQIVFQGVRRFKGYRRPPSYPFWPDEWKYPGDVTVDPAWTLGETRRFAIPIYDCDFELLRIVETIINPIGGGQPQPPGGTNGQAIKLQLFDQVNETVFSAPIIDDLIMDNSTGYLGITPVPGIVYRIGQSIRFEVTPLVIPADCSVQVQLCFHGVRRRPC